MDTRQADETILKTDVLGRVKTSSSRREQLLDEFEQSGLNGKKYAELVGVKYQTFACWAQKRRRARGTYEKLPAKLQPKPQAARWLEAVVKEAQHVDSGKRQSVVLELRGGARVEIENETQAALAAALLRELEKPC